LFTKYRSIIVSFTIATAVGTSGRGADDPPGQRWWSHVSALAGDALEGRETGSEGHRKAAKYVAHAFEQLGLKPGGTDGFIQTVALKSRRIDESQSSLSLERAGGVENLQLGREALISMRVDPAPAIDAELVFAGHGLTIPEAGHDDFAGLDVRGKVVVFLMGAPRSIPGPLAAHMQSGAERAKVLRRAGAIGTAAILNPRSMDIPWERATLARFLPAMSLAATDLDETRGQKIAITVNPEHADRFLSGSGHTFGEILIAADENKPLPRFPIPARLHAKVGLTRADLGSQNVVGALPGTDPMLAKEYVVFSAHLDHIGVGKPIDGDAINNGAMDNASGVASLLDVAAILRDSGVKLRRSVLFIAVTGEEKGLLGSRYFATHPTVDPERLVANINVDMFLPLFPLKLLTIYGLAESDLGEDATAVAKALGVAPQADLEPQRNLFIRSDQYSFIRQGIPALALKVGFEKGSPEEAIAKAWLKARYHAPSDDLNQPVDREAAAAFDRLVAKLLERVANREQRPRWNETSFFKRFAK
jgi:hypothetical protein